MSSGAAGGGGACAETLVGGVAVAERAAGIGQTPAGRLAGPDEPADLVAFLCSPEGRWINGQILFSNGGVVITGTPWKASPNQRPA